MYELKQHLPRRALVVGCLCLFTSACDRDPTPPGIQPSDPAAQPSPAQQAPAQGVAPSAAPDQAQAPDSPAAEPGAAQPAAPAEGESLPEKQIDDFARALEAAMQVQQTYQHELAKVEDPEQAKALQNAALVKIRERVEATGMDFETYNAISQRLQSDQELRASVEQRLGARGQP